MFKVCPVVYVFISNERGSMLYVDVKTLWRFILRFSLQDLTKHLVSNFDGIENLMNTGNSHR